MAVIAQSHPSIAMMLFTRNIANCDMLKDIRPEFENFFLSFPPRRIEANVLIILK